MILINGNWEIVKNLHDVSKIVREYYNDELADKLDSLIPDYEYVDEDKITELEYEISVLEDEISMLEEENYDLNNKVTKLELENTRIKECIKEVL